MRTLGSISAGGGESLAAPAIAFLLTGPATNLTTFGVLSRLHGRGIAVAFAAAVVVATVGIGYAVSFALPHAGASLPTLSGEHTHTTLQFGALTLLSAAFLVSFLRQGTRGFVGQVISPHGEAEHHHDHDHGEHGGGCGHDDEHAGEPAYEPAGS